MKTMKKVCHFSHADREEENTEDDQIEYESNEECVLQEMEDDIQALDSQEERVGLLHEDIHQELVVKEMEIGELQLDNEVLEHNFIKLESIQRGGEPKPTCTNATCAVTIHCTYSGTPLIQTPEIRTPR